MNALSDFQPELNLRAQAACKVNADAVHELCGLLRGRGWVTARQLRELRPEWTERFIRALASASGTRVVSGPGTPGYILAEGITDEQLEQLQHAGRSMVSQGRDMARRGIRFLRLHALRSKAAQVASEPSPCALRPSPFLR